jgi:hypothetical protein
MCEVSSMIQGFVRSLGESINPNISVIRTRRLVSLGRGVRWRSLIELYQTFLESLILAQDERWRRA